MKTAPKLRIRKCVLELGRRVVEEPRRLTKLRREGIMVEVGSDAQTQVGGMS